MRAGRLPDDHPLERIARDKLRELSPEAREAVAQEEEEQQATEPVRRLPARKLPARWTPNR